MTPKSSINSSREKATSPDPSEDYHNQVRRVVLELPNLEKSLKVRHFTQREAILSQEAKVRRETRIVAIDWNLS